MHIVSKYGCLFESEGRVGTGVFTNQACASNRNCASQLQSGCCGQFICFVRLVRGFNFEFRHSGGNFGKAVEIPEAIRKGKEDAAKHLVTVPVNENGSIPYDWNGEFGSATVLLKSAPEGTGIIAGGPARNVLELAGYKNIRTKSLGSNNKQNVVLATIKGLSEIKTPEEIARLRGKSVDEILN